MIPRHLAQLFEAVAAGKTTPEQAAQAFEQQQQGFAETGGFAHVDLHRRARCGFPEVVFGLGKTAEQIVAIVGKLVEHGQGCLVTRVDPRSADRIQAAFPEGVYNPVARTFHKPGPEAEGPKVGRVAVVTAGTSDLPVAEEARVTAEARNCEVDMLVDVGVAGLHRLLSRRDRLTDVDALVVVAGMEGALPSVVGGLTSCPVIAVPTSIGYGANFQGLAALLGMLNSCASNVVVVNIDAGFNGGYVAGLIAQRAGTARGQAGGPSNGKSD
ncbi:nickel pincer cofactor biosynthesis protein LarB [Paludisphaera soli]|uniref:nickel pincer cofactor biosynthesis protein LarB n=1 Tax=Paludisphaera soli TaxID=2712865 RepID=UPI0013EA44D8|nr:nickel pincer cofactor biosynthesis protein LarB [Paludisphaera soli]